MIGMIMAVSCGSPHLSINHKLSVDSSKIFCYTCYMFESLLKALTLIEGEGRTHFLPQYFGGIKKKTKQKITSLVKSSEKLTTLVSQLLETEVQKERYK